MGQMSYQFKAIAVCDEPLARYYKNGAHHPSSFQLGWASRNYCVYALRTFKSGAHMYVEFGCNNGADLNNFQEYIADRALLIPGVICRKN